MPQGSTMHVGTEVSVWYVLGMNSRLLLGMLKSGGWRTGKWEATEGLKSLVHELRF